MINIVDTRQVHRDALFLLGQLRVVGQDGCHRVKIRNLSPRGLMAEGAIAVAHGALVAVEVRSLGWIEGTVAWRQDDRFGIAFLEDVDTGPALEPSAPNEGS